MFSSKNKIIEMQEATIKDQEEIIKKKNLENMRLKDCMKKIEEKIAKGESKKIPFAIIEGEIKEVISYCKTK